MCTTRLRIGVFTLGCKVNQYETACIGEDFAREGFELVGFDEDAEIYLINTCTVTNRTDFKSRNAIRKALAKKAANPGVRVVVTGCYAQRNRDDVLGLGDIDAIVDNQAKPDLWKILRDQVPGFRNPAEFVGYPEHSTSNNVERNRAMLKIQDGCEFFCTYCAVAHARGPFRSRTPESVIREVRRFVGAAFHEIVLTGINLGMWGIDLGLNLPGLMKTLEAEEGPDILRLSSLEPVCITPELIGIMADSSKFARHLHIPLQSGSDEILRRMGRKYDSETFSGVVNALRQAMPDIALGFDVIVGFPGETDSHHQQTHDFLAAMAPAYLHVFGFSPRPGTPAAMYPDQIHGSVIKHRSENLRMLAAESKQRYEQSLIANETRLRGIRESGNSALSDHGIRMMGPFRTAPPGSLIRGIPIRIHKDGVWCREA